MPSIWNKFQIIKEMNTISNQDSNTTVKTYLTRIEPIIKEIIPKDKDNLEIIHERFDELKKELKIYDIIEENDRIYIIIDNNEKIKNKVDNMLMSNDLNIQQEVVLEGHGNPVTKEEIMNLFKMEESVCKIKFEREEFGQIKKGSGSGFFCEIEKKDFPMKYCLFTNYHVLNETNIEIGSKINFEYYNGKKYIKKEIKIDKDRKVLTNKKIDCTCIEIFKSDGIKKFFKIDPYIYKNNDIYFSEKDSDVFILHYPNGEDISFSYGKIKYLEGDFIKHSASTAKGSSGSPIIRRSSDNYVIGLHFGGDKNNKYNKATKFSAILEKIEGNTINCIYIPIENEKEISLIYDYDENVRDWGEKSKKIFLETKEINQKLFKEKLELYVNENKINFDFKYKVNDSKEIKVKFKFKTKLIDTSFMFRNCSSLISIDFSSFSTMNVNNMYSMFENCYSLKSIDLSSFITSKVQNMSYMFFYCQSLKSLDLSSFNTSNVKDMSSMFHGCASLETINLSSFDMKNVQDKNNMFLMCPSLKMDLSSYK